MGMMQNVIVKSLRNLSLASKPAFAAGIAAMFALAPANAQAPGLAMLDKLAKGECCQTKESCR